MGAVALATTSTGHTGARGRRDQHVDRGELLAYGALIEAAREVLGQGTSGYSARVLDTRLRDQAFE